MEKYILRQLYNTYQKEIYLYLYALCKSKDLAEDLMQETFMKAILSLPNEHTNMRAWLYMVARNLYFNHRQKERRNILLDHVEDSSNSSDSDMLERLLIDERKRLLFQALQKLSDIKREILTMQYYGDLSQKEIAALLKLTPENVRVLAYRARRELKLYLEESGYDIS